MYVELLARSERCIEQQHDHELSVSALWEKVKALAAKDHFVLPDTMSDFECLLEGDKRFRLSEMKSDDGEVLEREPDEDSIFLDDEVEGLGFDHEQKVTLTRFYRVDDEDDGDDEAFAPRPFEKNDDGTASGPAPRVKKTTAAAAPVKKTAAPGDKKPVRKKTITKRK